MPSDVSDQEADDSTTAGRPKCDIMENLTVEIKSDTDVRRYRCVGIDCPKVFRPRTLTRVLKHAKRCIKLTPEQQKYASKSSSQGLSAEALKPPEPVEFFGPAGEKQVREYHAAKLDLAIVNLFSAAGLPPSLADYPEYKDVFNRRTILIDNHIMSEQERVRAAQIAFLKTQQHLAVSFDGGDLEGGEYFYTVTASTADGCSFLLEGFECTKVSHTAEWMADMVLKVMKTVGVERFIAASSDEAGNTRGCRGIICTKVPTILDLPDPNHHLSNTVKDIVQLPYFKLPIKILPGTIKSYSHSKEAKGLLKDLRVQGGTGRGLETIGKTRFATIAWSSISLRRNLPWIRTLSTNGQVEIKKYNDYFIKDTPKTLDFEMKLNQLIVVTEGPAKAIQCLEAASCNVADVYLLWLALTAHIRAALRTSMIPETVCNEIWGIINHRWRQFFIRNPGHEAYQAGFYLNPKYVNSTVYKRLNAVAPVTITIPAIQHLPPAASVPIGVRNPTTFKEVGAYLYKIGLIEVDHSVNPVLVAFKKKKLAFKKQFVTQFGVYAQGSFPFNTLLGDTHPLVWWRRLEGSEHGGLLAVIQSIAVKLYSAVPHSMADERTVSVITWMNTALRNREKVDTVFSFVQIRGWKRDQDKQKVLIDGTYKSRSGARPHPDVKFYNIDREILAMPDDNKLHNVDEDDAPESDDNSGPTGATAMPDWLNLPREVVPASTELDLEDGELNLDWDMLADVLADAPVVRTVATSNAGSVGRANTEVDSDEDDEMSYDLECHVHAPPKSLTAIIGHQAGLPNLDMIALILVCRGDRWCTAFGRKGSSAELNDENDPSSGD
ncbi:ribonuclease H-like domain-containing protein, partial [Mycena crocata]